LARGDVFSNRQPLELEVFIELTRQLLDQPLIWRAVRRLARRLVRERNISGAEVEGFFKELDVPRVGGSYSRSVTR
jgi:hypothetical protein